MPAYPIYVRFENPPEQGYAHSLLRFKAKDKEVVDKAAALVEMDRGPFYRVVLLRVAEAIIAQHAAIAVGELEAPTDFNQDSVQRRVLRKQRRKAK